MLRRRHTAFTLIELLIVIAVIGILAGLVMPSSTPTLFDQVRSAAGIMRADLGYARSLAVTYNSSYRVTFDTTNNRYILKHVGSNPALNNLPASPFRLPSDPPDQHIVDFDDLPHVGPAARIVAAGSGQSAPQRVTDVEFGPLGQTARSSSTTIWLAVGSGSGTRYITVTVNPVTGLTEIGGYSSTGPPAAVLP